MDPNETLKELLEYLKGWQYNQNTPLKQRNAERPQYAPYTLHAKAHYYDKVMEHFGNLNEWLSNGGFLPKEWERSGWAFYREHQQR